MKYLRIVAHIAIFAYVILICMAIVGIGTRNPRELLSFADTYIGVSILPLLCITETKPEHFKKVKNFRIFVALLCTTVILSPVATLMNANSNSEVTIAFFGMIFAISAVALWVVHLVQKRKSKKVLKASE